MGIVLWRIDSLALDGFFLAKISHGCNCVGFGSSEIRSGRTGWFYRSGVVFTPSLLNLSAQRTEGQSKLRAFHRIFLCIEHQIEHGVMTSIEISCVLGNIRDRILPIFEIFEISA